MKELQFRVDIQATKEKVWETLWRDETFRQWAGLIDPGTYVVGELKEGNEVQFISAENGYGVTSLVEKLVPNECCYDTAKIRKAAGNNSVKSSGLAARKATP